MSTVGQLILLALPRVCTCGHRPFDHHGMWRDCEADDTCQCMHYTEAVE